MAQETLKLVITADNADALAKIKQFSESLGAQTKEWEKNKKATGDATNALTNFSRLAEDSAYGLRGAANNINPFIESFKRLKDETGSTKAALLSMAQGLIGPAGILVAVSAISSIWIKYSDAQNKAKKDAEELAKADNSSAEAIKKKKEAIESIYEAQSKEVTQVSTLVAIINNETESRNRKKDALKELQKISPDIFAGLKLEGDVVKGLNTAYEQYINNISTVIAVKIKQKELEEVTEKILKLNGVTLTQEEKVIKNIGEGYTKLRIASANDVESRKIATEESAKRTKKESELNTALTYQKNILKEISELSKGAKIGGGGGTSGETEKKDPFVEATKDFNNAVETNLQLLQAAKISQKSYYDNYLDIVKGYVNKLKGIDTKEARQKILELTPKELISKRPDYYDADLEAQSAAMDKFEPTGSLIKMFGKDFGLIDKAQSKESFESGKKEMDKFFKETEKNFDQANKKALQFAETLATEATGAIRGMWEAMKSGENILNALGDAFLRLAEDIAFTIIKMEILAALKTALKIGGAVATGGASEAGGGVSGILGLIGNLLMGNAGGDAGGGDATAMAAGGIVTKPTYALIGEGNESEAVMPLSKLSGFLNTTFNAGAMSATGQNGGQFVLKGNDLVLALQRSNYNLNLRRGI